MSSVDLIKTLEASARLLFLVSYLGCETCVVCVNVRVRVRACACLWGVVYMNV